MKTIFHVLLALAFNSALCFAAATSNATSFKVTVYGAWLSASGDCSNPVEIMTSTSGTEIDMLQSPTIGQKAIAAGTYKCLILKLNDIMKFTPDSNSPAPCVSTREETIQTCIPSNSVNASKNPFTGDSIACTNSTSTGDELYVYVSRNSFCSSSTSPSECVGHFPNAFLPPTAEGDKDRGFKLDSDIVISGDTTGTFIFNTDGMVALLNGACNLEGFLLSYR